MMLMGRKYSTFSLEEQRPYAYLTPFSPLGIPTLNEKLFFPSHLEGETILWLCWDSIPGTLALQPGALPI